MSWMRFLHRKRSDSELQDEIEAFLTEETADNEARGMSPDEARRQARLKFGNPQKVRESLWVQNTPQQLAGIARDVKYAFRTLRRTPGLLQRPEQPNERSNAPPAPSRPAGQFHSGPHFHKPAIRTYLPFCPLTLPSEGRITARSQCLTSACERDA